VLTQPPRSRRRTGAWVFVLTAVALAVGAVLMLQSPATSRRVHIVGPGAAPPRQSQAPTQARIFNTRESPNELGALAVGAVSELAPIPPRAFDAPIARYRVYASGEAKALAAAAARLTSALRSGTRTQAQAAWAQTDSLFARIGGAYGALGTVGQELDGAPGGLPLGARDPRFVGLQRIELGLWTGAAPASLVRFGALLQTDIGKLGQVLRTSPISPLTYATRAHEILEDVQRDRLTAVTPSDSGVRATADGAAATEVVLGTLSGLLAGRGDALAQSEYWLHQLGGTLATIRRDHGGRYPPVSGLSTTEHETLDGRLGATLEALEGIPGELETTRPPTLTRIP
jgi:hypothetical protein